MKIFKIIFYKLRLIRYKKLWKEALELEQEFPVGSSKWRAWVNVAADYSCEYYNTKQKLDDLRA